MTISEAEKLVTSEYNDECLEAQQSPRFNYMISAVIGHEYQEIDQFLPDYVAEIAGSMGVPPGTQLPDYVYQMARMVFRLGMRVQRKIEHPDVPSTIFWESGVIQ